MTTTAEKIKVMQAFEDGQQIEWRPIHCKSPWLKTETSPIWEWSNCDYRIKPADPEPLECWVNMYNDLRGDTYATGTEALLNLRQPHEYRQIHMREVTSQGEQDRKDAERYRYLKSRPYRFSSVDYVDFDKEIDEAMEEE